MRYIIVFVRCLFDVIKKVNTAFSGELVPLFIGCFSWLQSAVQ